MSHVFNCDACLTRQMCNLVLALVFLKNQSTVRLLIEHTEIPTLPLIPKLTLTSHELGCGTFHHCSNSNNRSRLPRFQAPLRRLKMPFIFKVQRTIRKKRRGSLRRMLLENIYLHKLPQKPRQEKTASAKMK